MENGVTQNTLAAPCKISLISNLHITQPTSPEVLMISLPRKAPLPCAAHRTCTWAQMAQLPPASVLLPASQCSEALWPCLWPWDEWLSTLRLKLWPLPALQALIQMAYWLFQQNDLVGETQTHTTTKLSFVRSCVVSHMSILSASHPALLLLEAARPGGLGPSLTRLCSLCRSRYRPSLSLAVGSLHLWRSVLPRQVSPSTDLTIHSPAKSFCDCPAGPRGSSWLPLSVSPCPDALPTPPTSEPFLQREPLLLLASPFVFCDGSLGSLRPGRKCPRQSSILSQNPLHLFGATLELCDLFLPQTPSVSAAPPPSLGTGVL